MGAPENTSHLPYGASSVTGEAFAAFCDVIASLRAPGGCPWDAEQTHQSISQNMIEEACEAVEAIEAKDADHLCEELGDVLLEVVMQANIAAEAGEFTIDDVIAGIHDKMVRRHPHVFGASVALKAAGFSEEEIQAATTPGAVEDMWAHIKAHERAMKEEARRQKALAAGEDPDAAEGLLDSVPRALPALQQAQKISKRAAKCGFEWDTTDQVWDKFEEERGEFAQALGTEHAAEELGDMLFTLVNVARKEHIDAEQALRDVCTKFRRRWAIMERHAREVEGIALEELDSSCYEQLWNEAKEELGRDQ